MLRPSWLAAFLFLGAAVNLFAANCHAANQQTSRPPNVIIIYADDLGWGDLACYGHPTIRTPHLDRMAAEGMRFTQFYSAAEVCTPSRAALLTGRYPIRNGMCHDQFRVLRNNSEGGLPKEELTIAEALKTKGYSTGCIGKWHLGHLPHHLPAQHGFDFYFGLPYSNDMQPAPDAPKGRDKFFVEKNEFWRTPLIRGTEIVEPQPDQTKLTRRYADEAAKFIRDHQAKPFFLYVAHTFPHVPLFASEKFRGRSPAGIYGDVVEELDASVGQILDTLRTTGLAENTLVFFSSDNGPWLIFNQHGGSAGLLREGKGSTWEGGMRVPGIFWWPGKIPAGAIQREVGLTMDLLPTCCQLAGAVLPTDRTLDGRDLSPLLFHAPQSDGAARMPRDLFVYYRGQTLYAARLGAWKLHFMTRSAYGPDKPETHDPPLLFNLEIDPSERFNVADKNPNIVARITRAVEQHRAGVTAAPSQLIDVVGGE